VVCEKKNKGVINSLFVFTFLWMVLEISSCSHNSAVCEKRTHIYLTISVVFFISLCELLILTQQSPSSINSFGIDLCFHISPQKKEKWEDSRQVSAQARKLEFHIRYLCIIQDEFWAATDSLDNWNVLEHGRAETTCEDTYWTTHLPIVHLNVFKEN
jgi:hypothetical protein